MIDQDQPISTIYKKILYKMQYLNKSLDIVSAKSLLSIFTDIFIL